MPFCRWPVDVSLLLALACAACSQPPPARDSAADASVIDEDHPEPFDAIAAMDSAADASVIDDASSDRRAIAYTDAPTRDRTAPDAGPRCYGLPPSAGLLQHVAHIPRESGGSSNGASACVGDVDNDGVRELIVPRLNEPSEIIGPDWCSRGRVLLPNYARGCFVADLDGDRRNELVVIGNEGWSGRGMLEVGRVERATASDRTLESHVFRDLWPFEENRPIATATTSHANVIDLDGDGRLELFVGGNFPRAFVRVWELATPPPSSTWTEVLDLDLVGSLNDSVGSLSEDIDGDGTREAIVVGSCAPAGTQHGHRVWRRWDQPPILLPRRDPSHLIVADLDGVSPPEVVIANRSNCDSNAVSSWPLEVHRFDGARNALSLVAQRVTGLQQREANLIAAIDVVGSPASEVLYCSTPSGVLVAPRTCALFALESTPTNALVPVIAPGEMTAFRWASPPRLGGFDGMIVDDLDGDGAREVFLFGQEHIDVLRGPRR